jgi:hypothetical protein
MCVRTFSTKWRPPDPARRQWLCDGHDVGWSAANATVLAANATVLLSCRHKARKGDTVSTTEVREPREALYGS